VIKYRQNFSLTEIIPTCFTKSKIKEKTPYDAFSLLTGNLKPAGLIAGMKTLLSCCVAAVLSDKHRKIFFHSPLPLYILQSGCNIHPFLLL
jgi:hypothetical protein